MRDPNRIQSFCDELKGMWSSVPDWRFGQLICNALGAYASETRRDVFYTEDEQLFDFLRKYFYEKKGECDGSKDSCEAV